MKINIKNQNKTSNSGLKKAGTNGVISGLKKAGRVAALTGVFGMTAATGMITTVIMVDSGRRVKGEFTPLEVHKKHFWCKDQVTYLNSYTKAPLTEAGQKLLQVRRCDNE